MRLLVQALETDRLHVAGHLAVEPRRRDRLLGDHLPDGFRRRPRPERGSARQQFVEDGSEGINVDGWAPRERPGFSLFGGHVARRPHRDAGPGEAGLAFHPSGQPEVADLGGAIGGEEDVGRFQVAMHDPAPVGRLDGLGQGAQQRGGLAGRQRIARQLLGQVAALDEFHREVRLAVVVAHVVDLDDIRVLQAGRRFRFPKEALPRLRAGMRAVQQHLEGDAAVEAQLPGLVDHAHPAAAEQFVDFMPRDLGQVGRGQLRRRVAGCRVGHQRREQQIQVGVAAEFSTPMLADLREQFGAIAADLFGRMLRVQERFEQ